MHVTPGLISRIEKFTLSVLCAQTFFISSVATVASAKSNMMVWSPYRTGVQINWSETSLLVRSLNQHPPCIKGFIRSKSLEEMASVQ